MRDFVRKVDEARTAPLLLSILKQMDQSSLNDFVSLHEPVGIEVPDAQEARAWLEERLKHVTPGKGSVKDTAKKSLVPKLLPAQKGSQRMPFGRAEDYNTAPPVEVRERLASLMVSNSKIINSA